MKIAIMKPYLFPYIGYFQLINAVNHFVFYDDVNYIKGGWINRNNILVKNDKKFITLNLVASSTNKNINEIKVGSGSRKVLKTIKQTYVKAPFFNEVFPLIEEVFKTINKDSLISKIAGLSTVRVAEYLGIKTIFEYSSVKYLDTNGLERADRLIEICKRNNSKTYINAIGGRDLYSKQEFEREGIDLSFFLTEKITYKQLVEDFTPNLSIIDVMMFNSTEEIRKMLNQYSLL
jgi:hypothetical protein